MTIYFNSCVTKGAEIRIGFDKIQTRSDADGTAPYFFRHIC